jgi:hypothetical protein
MEPEYRKLLAVLLAAFLAAVIGFDVLDRGLPTRFSLRALLVGMVLAAIVVALLGYSLR